MTDKEILDKYAETQSIRATASCLGLAPQTVKRRLITHGVYTSPIVRNVDELLRAGYTVQEAAKELGIGVNAVLANMPHTKGSYAIGEKTENAKRIEKCRNKKAAKKEDE